MITWVWKAEKSEVLVALAHNLPQGQSFLKFFKRNPHESYRGWNMDSPQYIEEPAVISSDRIVVKEGGSINQQNHGHKFLG